MNEIILDCYELAASCLPSAIVATLFLRRAHRRPTRHELAGAALLIVYVAAVLHVTGAGTLPDGMRRGMPRFDQCNLVPFINGADPVQCLLNVALFVPFGCFLAVAFNEDGSAAGKRKAFIFAKRLANGHNRAATHCAKAALGGFAFSFAVETSQLLTNRVSDIDDLAMNTLGACMGCAVALACMRITRVRTPRKASLVCSRQSMHTAMLTVIIAAAFLGRFLFFDEMAAAAALYGF